MGLSAAAKERALSHVFCGRDLWLGLASHLNERGLLVELGDPAYARQQVRFEIDPATSEARNRARIVFPPFASDSDEVVRWFFVVDAKGDLLSDGELQPRIVDTETGDAYSIAEARERTKELGPEFEARLRRNFVRVRAGMEAVFPPGMLVIAIGEEQ